MTSEPFGPNPIIWSAFVDGLSTSDDGRFAIGRGWNERGTRIVWHLADGAKKVAESKSVRDLVFEANRLRNGDGARSEDRAPRGELHPTSLGRLDGKDRN